MKMKKFFYLAMLAIAPLAFTACGSDDNEGGGNGGGGTTPQQETKMKAPQFKDDAMKIEVTKAEAPVLKSVTDEEFAMTTLELTESGNYVIEITPTDEETTDGKSDFLFGTYDKLDATDKDATYKLENFGELTVISKKDGKVSAVLTVNENAITSSGAKKMRKAPSVFDFTGSIVVGQNASASVRFGNLCRTWSIQKSELTVKVDGKNVAYRGAGFDLHKIIKTLNSNGIEVEETAEYLKNPNKYVTGLMLTAAGSYIITYADGSCDYGTYNLNLSTNDFTYSWKDSSMGTSFENGKATLTWKDGAYVLTIDTNFSYKNKNYTSAASLWFVEK